MKPDIHPTYHEAAAVVCSCGETFTVGSTLPKIHIEICSACHPFFSGQEKIMDTAGRVEKFTKRRVKSINMKSNAPNSYGVVNLSG